jgi:hypothetical protein
MPTKTLCPKCHGQRTTSCVAASAALVGRRIGRLLRGACPARLLERFADADDGAPVSSRRSHEIPMLPSHRIALSARNCRIGPNAKPVNIFLRPSRCLAYRPRPCFDAIRWRVVSSPSVRSEMVGCFAIVIGHAAKKAEITAFTRRLLSSMIVRFLKGQPWTSLKRVASIMPGQCWWRTVWIPLKSKNSLTSVGAGPN